MINKENLSAVFDYEIEGTIDQYTKTSNQKNLADYSFISNIIKQKSKTDQDTPILNNSFSLKLMNKIQQEEIIKEKVPVIQQRSSLLYIKNKINSWKNPLAGFFAFLIAIFALNLNLNLVNPITTVATNNNQDYINNTIPFLNGISVNKVAFNPNKTINTTDLTNKASNSNNLLVSEQDINKLNILFRNYITVKRTSSLSKK